MKKKATRPRTAVDRAKMRSHYDFSTGVRGATAVRYVKGSNVVVIDPTVLDVFPDGVAVNEAMRALAPLLRGQRLARIDALRARLAVEPLDDATINRMKRTGRL